MEASQYKKYSLLVVDDNEMNRDLMYLQLTRKGYGVTLADSGYEALERLETEPFDLVLLDIMMPGLNGLQVLEKVREQHSMLQLPIIMVTADDLHERIIEALQKGANDYIVKPFYLPVTVARIKTQLELKELSNLKDQFVQFASHDLKKPLIVSQDIVETLQKNCVAGNPIQPDTPELLSLLHKTGETMQDVISGFLNLDQLDGGQITLQCKFSDLNHLVEKCISSNQEYAKQKLISLVKRLDHNIPEIEVDEFRLSQVLENLVGNALKFSPKNTTTSIITYADKNYAYVEVCDGGPGLTDDDQKSLFVSHAKLSNKPTGNENSSGVGLSLSKQMIDLHNGQIGARNNQVSGTTFWFAVPITQTSTNVINNRNAN